MLVSMYALPVNKIECLLLLCLCHLCVDVVCVCREFDWCLWC